MSYLVIAGIVLALLFDFLNGMNDAGNSVATIVSTKVLSPLAAVAWAAFFNFAAAFIFGLNIANTIGKGIIQPVIINEYFVMAALIGAIIWVFTCTRFGIPISVSHALIGGLMGPAILIGGVKYVVWKGILKVVVFIVLAPIFGMIISYILMIFTMLIFKKVSPFKIDRYFRVLQLFSSAIFSLGHGSNDAQKTMGIVAVLLFTSGMIGPEFYIPTWVVFAAYTSIALGTLTGAWNTIRTLGMRLTHLKPVQGFSAETAGAITLMATSALGIPVSTTHTITGAIVGVGLTRRLSAIRWALATNIVLAWILTIPTTAMVSMGIYWLVSHIFHVVH